MQNKTELASIGVLKAKYFYCNITQYSAVKKRVKIYKPRVIMTVVCFTLAIIQMRVLNIVHSGLQCYCVLSKMLYLSNKSGKLPLFSLSLSLSISKLSCKACLVLCKGRRTCSLLFSGTHKSCLLTLYLFILLVSFVDIFF